MNKLIKNGDFTASLELVFKQLTQHGEGAHNNQHEVRIYENQTCLRSVIALAYQQLDVYTHS